MGLTSALEHHGDRARKAGQGHVLWPQKEELRQMDLTGVSGGIEEGIV